MDITRIESAVDSQAESFDTLARTLNHRVQRRRVFGLLVATLATGVLGTAVRTEEASAKRKGKGSKGGKSGGRRPRPTPQPLPLPPVQPPGQPPVQQPDASERCLAAGNQCGTNANQQGTCRVAAAPDNQAGFICTSNQAGNACTASTQCGAGTRCVIQGAAQTCRVVIG